MITSGRRGPGAAAGLALAIFIAALDQTVVVTALPSIITDLEIPFTKLNQAAWIVTGYLLGYTVAMPLFGRVSDLYGRRRTYILCALLFVIGSLLCGLASDLYWLIGARMLQAAGGGAIVPVAMGIVGDALPPQKRSMALGAIGAVAEAGGVLGPLYGAFVIQQLDWRWIFYLNLPLGLMVIASAYLLGRDDGRSRGSVDLRGAGLIGASLGALTIGLSLETGPGASPLPAVLLVALAAGLIALFVWVETRVSEPLLDLKMFGRRGFTAGNLASLLVGMALITAMVDVPLFAATILRRSPLDGGLMLMRLTAALPVGALVGGALCQCLGVRSTAALGLALSAAGLYLTGQWTSEVDQWQLTRDLVLAGLGFGLVIAPVTGSVLNAAGAARAGVASALVTLMRMVGMMVGLSGLTSWGLGRFNALVAAIPFPMPGGEEAQGAWQERLQAYQQGVLGATLTVFHEIFVAAAVVCLLATVVVLFLRGKDGD